MRARGLLIGGIVMPVIYFTGLLVAGLLYPGWAPLTQPPSDLGAESARYGPIMNLGLIGSGLAGVSGAAGLWVGLRSNGAPLILAGPAALSLALGSVGLGMSGVYPLPDPLHHSFGLLTLTAALTPLLGALALWRTGGSQRAALVLALAFVAIAGLVIAGPGPLLPGGIALFAVAFLCWVVRHRAGWTAYPSA